MPVLARPAAAGLFPALSLSLSIRYCLPEHLEPLAEKFHKLREEAWSGCATHDWLAKLQGEPAARAPLAGRGADACPQRLTCSSRASVCLAFPSFPAEISDPHANHSFIDIGCNKGGLNCRAVPGRCAHCARCPLPSCCDSPSAHAPAAGYTSSAYFGMFAPDLGFNPKAIIAWRPNHGCGVCMDCEDEVRCV